MQLQEAAPVALELPDNAVPAGAPGAGPATSPTKDIVRAGGRSTMGSSKPGIRYLIRHPASLQALSPECICLQYSDLNCIVSLPSPTRAVDEAS